MEIPALAALVTEVLCNQVELEVIYVGAKCVTMGTTSDIIHSWHL